MLTRQGALTANRKCNWFCWLMEIGTLQLYATKAIIILHFNKTSSHIYWLHLVITPEKISVYFYFINTPLLSIEKLTLFLNDLRWTQLLKWNWSSTYRCYFLWWLQIKCQLQMQSAAAIAALCVVDVVLAIFFAVIVTTVAIVFGWITGIDVITMCRLPVVTRKGNLKEILEETTRWKHKNYLKVSMLMEAIP